MTLQVKNYISRNRVERASEGNNMLVNVFKKQGRAVTKTCKVRWLYILLLQIYYSIRLPKIMKIGWHTLNLQTNAMWALFIETQCSIEISLIVNLILNFCNNLIWCLLSSIMLAYMLLMLLFEGLLLYVTASHWVSSIIAGTPNPWRAARIYLCISAPTVALLDGLT